MISQKRWRVVVSIPAVGSSKREYQACQLDREQRQEDVFVPLRVCSQTADTDRL